MERIKNNNMYDVNLTTKKEKYIFSLLKKEKRI